MSQAALFDLCVGHLRRFQQTWAREDADAAIEIGERYLTLYGSDLPMMNNLGAAYQNRYNLTRASSDLDRAIELAEQVLELTSSNDPARPGRLWNVSSAYGERFYHNRAVDDLRSSIRYGEKSLASYVRPFPEEPQFHSDMCMMYTELHKLSEEQRMSDLDRAISHGTSAVSLLSPRDARRGRALGDLGAAYLARFDVYRDTADADAALTHTQAALEATPPEPAEHHAQRLGDLADVCRLRQGCGLPVSLDLLDELAAQAERLPRVTAWTRLRTTRLTGTALMQAGLLRAADVFRIAVETLPELASELPAADQVRVLRDQQLTVSQAVEAQLAIGDIEQAVQLAEIGRGTMLRNRMPWDLSQAELSEAADDDAIVVLNVTAGRSHAILITASGWDVLWLDELNYFEACRSVENLRRATNPNYPALAPERRPLFADTLRWLWHKVVGPILHKLGYDHVQSRPRRIWWVPLGAMTLLPLHAAGLPDGPSALDLAVSSYAPTLSSLLECRLRPASAVRRQLTVAMQGAAGLRDLAKTAIEALDPAISSPTATVLQGERATVRAVLAALPQATWAHFACHAIADADDPLKGQLVLADGGLTVDHIRGLHLPDAEFAYLSACATAQGKTHILDESIHLASAFHAAGFRHVIGTLWQADDEAAAAVAGNVYRGLGATAVEAPYALHRAVQRLRADNSECPDLWAPFIHIGP